MLTAFILDVDRFETPGKLVAYFGVLPIEASSGVDRDGRARAPRRLVMCRRGNDLVRRYLWMAAAGAIRCNPAVRALYARVVARHPKRKAVAVGHAMRKLLHLAFAVWKSGRPFDPNHYPWQTPAHAEGNDSDMSSGSQGSDNGMSSESQAAGLRPDEPGVDRGLRGLCRQRSGVGVGRRGRLFIDFAHLKRQLPLGACWTRLALSSRLKGSGAQRRGACPIHRGDGRGRTFSVHLEENVFQCFDSRCGKKGDAIDLWAALHGQSLREAALDLVRTFGLEPAAGGGTEKRHG